MAALNIFYLLVVPCALYVVLAYHGEDLPPGPYCGLAGECCVNRQDSCSHEILGTLCYCDEHCNRTHDDCCPDYEEVCLGIRYTPPPTTRPPEPLYSPPPRVCYRGQKRKQGCNECVCDVSPRTGELDWLCSEDLCIIDARVLDNVNRGATTWRAANYSEFQDKKLKDGIVYKLGTFPLTAETLRMFPIRYNKDIDYPRQFDSRTRWPGFVSPIVDQGWCGSDWAVSIAGIATDRFAIQSNGIENVQLSPQTLVSCNVRGQQSCNGGHIDIAWNFARTHGGQQSCNGGHIDIAWNFARTQGLVDENCFPYKGVKTPCPFKRRGNLIEDGCRPSVQKRTSRYKVGTPGRLQDEKDIMYDIMESGPVQAVMTVRQDFFHYRSGIYRHTRYGETALQGLHSVRIVGWGESDGDRYWIVANSWGREWGEDGYFRIARGDNESGIESFVVTVLAEVVKA